MIKIRRSLCAECQICMSVCSMHHFGVHTTKRSRIFVEAVWPDIPSISVCLACKNRECVGACPRGALSWDNWIHLTEDRCDSCGVCAEACPAKGIQMDPATGFPLICDTCMGAYQCVQWCPTRALERRE